MRIDSAQLNKRTGGPKDGIGRIVDLEEPFRLSRLVLDPKEPPVQIRQDGVDALKQGIKASQERIGPGPGPGLFGKVKEAASRLSTDPEETPKESEPDMSLGSALVEIERC